MGIASRRPQGRTAAWPRARTRSRMPGSSSRSPRCPARCCSPYWPPSLSRPLPVADLLWPDSGKVDELKGSSSGSGAQGGDVPDRCARRRRCRPARSTCGLDDVLDPAEPCGQSGATVSEGADKGTKATVDVPPEVSESGLVRGDQLVLLRTPGEAGQPAVLSYFEIERSNSLWLVGGLFVVVVGGVPGCAGSWRSSGSASAGAVVGFFVIPALLIGETGGTGRARRLGGDHVRRPVHDPRTRRRAPAPAAAAPPPTWC